MTKDNMIAKQKVTRIAETDLSRLLDGTPAISELMDLNDMPGSPAEWLIEFAGRTCYESYGRPREATGDTHKYIQRTVHEQYHFSIIEHASVSYFIEGVSRSLLAELSRHRHLSFSVRSQRFINEAEAKIVLPPAIRDLDDKYKDTSIFDSTTRRDSLIDALEGERELATETYDAIVDALTRSGLHRKQAREAARAVLPNMVEVKMVVTGNLRAWMEMIGKRDADGADAEIRELARTIHDDLNEYASSVFPK